MMSKKWCEENKAERAGRPPQGHREHRQLQGQRHRAVPPEGAPAVGAHGAGAQLQLLGQGRGQRRRGRLHADRQRRDARRRAAVGRDRRDGAGAAAGRRAHQGAPATSRCCRGRSCARSSSAWTRSATSCCSAASRARTRSRTCACARPSTRRSTIETIKTRVMRGAATPTGADGRARRARLPARHEQAPAVRPRGGEEAARRSRLPERLRGRHELPERPLRQRRGDLPGGGRQPGAHRRQGQPAGRDQGHATSRRSCAATPASTCSAGRRAPSTRTTRCQR